MMEQRDAVHRRLSQNQLYQTSLLRAPQLQHNLTPHMRCEAEILAHYAHPTPHDQEAAWLDPFETRLPGLGGPPFAQGWPISLTAGQAIGQFGARLDAAQLRGRTFDRFGPFNIWRLVDDECHARSGCLGDGDSVVDY